MPRTNAQIRARSIRQWIGGLLVVGWIVPVAVAARGGGAKFTWDVVDILGKRHVSLAQWAMAGFIVLPPLIGIVTFPLEGAARSKRAWTYVVFGGLVLACLFLFSSSVRGMGDPYMAIQSVVGAVVLVGTLVVLLRPGHPAGHRIAGISGGIALLLQFLPIAPDIRRGSGHTAAISNLIALLDQHVVGTFVGAVLFALVAAQFLSVLLAASLFSMDGGARGRAKLALWLTAGIYALMVFLPFIVLFSSGVGGRAFMPVLVVTVSFLILRTLPAAGLLAYGATDLALVRIAPDEVREMHAKGAAFADARECCREIGLAWRGVKARRVDAAAFRSQKVALLREAVRDARRTGKGSDLRVWVKQLVDLGALDASEASAVDRALAAATDAP
jgi:hypothetical protein